MRRTSGRLTGAWSAPSLRCVAPPTTQTSPFCQVRGHLCPSAELPLTGSDPHLGGEQRRVALAKLLLEGHDLLLLDEPTNHLDCQSVTWLERFLSEFSGTIVSITHDRYWLQESCQWILELDRGKGIPFEGNYGAWLEHRAKRLEAEKKQVRAACPCATAQLESLLTSGAGHPCRTTERPGPSSTSLNG